MKHLRLDGGHSTLVIDLSGEGIPRTSYWGSRLAENVTLDHLSLSASWPVYQGGLDAPYRLNMFPEEGRGFRGRPALSGHHKGLNWATSFHVTDVIATDHSAEIHLHDTVSELQLILDCFLDSEFGILQRRTRLKNLSTLPYELCFCSAGAISLPSFCSELLTFHGCWTGEFMTERSDISSGLKLFENRTGRTSHEFFPAIIAGSCGFNENSGTVYGTHLGWSGNARFFAECIPDGSRQIQMEELLLPAEIILENGEEYNSPWLYAGHSTTGLNGLSRIFHQFMRKSILPVQTATSRPTQFNSWEAIYFDHDLTTLKQLASKAAKIGIERFVLDDGWFHKRNNDTRALGDWWPDAGKYPSGLSPLIEHVKVEGMAFGLWVEPEMVNPDSDLYRNHPDWILHLADFSLQTGRNQLVLDLSKAEVADYLYQKLYTLLKENNIDYLKWDMNRILTLAGSSGIPAVHRQTNALYALLDRLRSEFPGVEMESCSSGGGRIDYEILKRTERFWASDSNDPFRRQQIQRGCSIFFPPEITGSHIGPATCHTSGRVTPVDFRAMTALFYHFGCEFNLFELSDKEEQSLQSYIAMHKQYRELLHQGDYVRLDLDQQLRNGYGVVAKDKNSALFCVVQLETPGQMADQSIRFCCLDPDNHYTLRILQPLAASIDNMLSDRNEWLSGITLPGSVLMETGISIYMGWPGTGVLFELIRQ